MKVINFLKKKVKEEFGIESGKGGLSLKKLYDWKPSEGVVACGFVFLLLLTLLPMLRLTQYTVPWYDDYTYSLPVKQAVDAGGGFFDAVGAAWNRQVLVSWYAWQGTFSSIFFMALMPAVWGQCYGIGPALVILLSVLGVFALVGVLAREVCGFGRAYTLAMQSAVSVIVLMFVYTAKAAFYWYNSGIHYVGMHSFLMIFIAASVKLLKTERRAVAALLTPVTVLGAFLASGANFVTTLQGLLAILTVAGLGLLCKNRRVLLLVPGLLGYVTGFYFNVSAPGNACRQAWFDDGYGAAEAILRSFWEAFAHLGEFTGLKTLAALVLLVPVIWQMVRKSSFSFRFPGLVLLWSVCLYATGFTPSLYSLGHAGLSRTLNVVKITYQLLLVINEVYWLGFFCRRMEKRGKEVPGGRCFWRFYPVMGLIMLLIFDREANPIGNYTAFGAYYYVHTGEAYNFYHEYLDRVALLEGEEKNVVVEPYNYKPWFLCMGELSDQPDAEENVAIAEWYGKDSVVCAEAE